MENSCTLLEVRRREGGGYKDAHISLQQQLIFHTQLTQNSEKLSNVSSWNIIVILRNVILECENIWLLVYDRAIEAPDTRPALKTLTKKKKLCSCSWPVELACSRMKSITIYTWSVNESRLYKHGVQFRLPLPL